MKEKLSLLAELIKLARCDKEVREQEYGFLLSIAKSLDVSKDVFDQLFEQHIEFMPPESEFARILQFHRLVLLMNIDQISSDSELKHLRTMGIRMGLNPIATEKVLAAMDTYPNKIVPPERLIEIFKENYN